MPVRADSIVGFLRDKLSTCSPELSCKYCGQCLDDLKRGWNEAITQQGSVKLTLNREKLAGMICDFAYQMNDSPELVNIYPQFKNANQEIKDYYIELADAIISKEAELIEVYKERT